MALTLAESSDLMKDTVFQGRVKAAALTYAQYLTLQPANSAGKVNWIQATMSAPDIMAQRIASPVVLNPNVQAAGAAVTDADLQAAVQAVADVMM